MKQLLFFLIGLPLSVFCQIDTNFHVFLLVGQSNMAGRGVAEKESILTDPRILMLDSLNQWVTAKDPLHFDKPKVVGVGPGFSFAKHILPSLPKNARIGLIPAAVGGSPISAWEPGAIYLKTFHPYDDAIKRAQLAQQKGVLKGILWHQGESDNDPLRSTLYLEQLTSLIARFRQDTKSPHVPFLVGEIGHFLKRDLINPKLHALPQLVNGTAVVSANGLIHKGDSTHFDSPSARELGKRYAQAYSSLPKPTVSSDTLAYRDIDLWPSGLPNSNGKDTSMPFSDKDQNFKPSIRVYHPAANRKTGRTLIAFPGGGYSGLAYNHEGYGFAPFFTELGITYVVLKYRMPNGNKEVPFRDAEEAIRMVKDSAKKWGILPEQIGIMGSSAGGHLASTIATHTSAALRPAYQILLYPVITMDSTFTHRGSRRNLLGNHPDAQLVAHYSNEKQVAAETPRAFIAFSHDDKVVHPLNGIRYYESLLQHQIPASIHIYPTGGHGWGIKESFRYRSAFLKNLTDWLNSF